MWKKTTILLCTLLLCICMILPVWAQTTYIIDDAGLLFQDEQNALEEKAQNLADQYDIQPVIVTVDSLGGTPAQDYADDFYDHGGFGEDGVLFLLAMAEREWYISTSGTMIYALTDFGIQQIGEGAVSYLSEGLWYDGFCYFLDTLPLYLTALENGIPVDGYADDSGSYYHGDQEEILYYPEESSPSFLLSLLCGMVVSGIVLLILRLSMNTKRPQSNASQYINDGSWNLTQKQDVFLYSNVTKTRKQDPPKSSGGGSSVHRSSGGRRHGGGGGKF